MSETARRAVRVAGMVLIAVALCVAGYAVYNLVSAEVYTETSLQEAEQMLSEMDLVTGLESLPPGSPDDPAAMFAEPSVGPEATMGDEPTPTDEDATAGPAPTAAAPTAKPKGGGGSKPTYTGVLIFDSLGGRKVPVLEGADAKNLNRGAVHHSRSSPPGGVGNCVIYGHRNTVFRSFGKLKIGDAVELVAPGQTIVYHISSMAIVEPDDRRIFQAYGKKVMTLVTCYPFHYTGSAPQRYIVVCVAD